MDERSVENGVGDVRVWATLTRECFVLRNVWYSKFRKKKSLEDLDGTTFEEGDLLVLIWMVCVASKSRRSLR